MLILNNNVLFLCNLVYAVAYGNYFYDLLSLYGEQNNSDCVDSIIPPQLSNEMVHLKNEVKGTTMSYSFRTVGTISVVEEELTNERNRIANIRALETDEDREIRLSADRFRHNLDRMLESSQDSNEDPVIRFRAIIHQALFGNSSQDITDKTAVTATVTDEDVDLLAHFPLGNIMRGELFHNRSAVHLPRQEYMHRGHCYLKLSLDYMQTAVNAFGILVQGNLDDVLRLPAHYVLKSARTIAMMKLAREKLVAMWLVVRGDQKPWEVPYETLELFRPLFKYLSGREIAKLNLSDPRILTYIGTHAELNRHQVGVVASQYIRMNPYWREPKYLNLMNNLLCGVPITLMKNAPESTYLQMSNQLFFHIRACDPLQRRFYLAMMSRTQILGKPNSWSARDVHRLGLLVTELDGPDLATINPEAFAGITAQLLIEMSTYNLQYITKRQIQHLRSKPANIMAKKVKNYGEALRVFNSAKRLASIWSYLLIIFKVQVLQWCK